MKLGEGTAATQVDMKEARNLQTTAEERLRKLEVELADREAAMAPGRAQASAAPPLATSAGSREGAHSHLLCCCCCSAERLCAPGTRSRRHRMRP